MIKVYFLILIGAFCTVFYFYGINVGKSKCEKQHYQEQIILTNKNTQQQRNVDETVYKTGTVDIRRILRDKYTIKE